MNKIILILIPLFFAGLINGQHATILFGGEKKQAINDYLDYLEAEDQIIGAVSIAKNGQEIYSRSFGQKNLPKQAIKAENLTYQIGSISKTFTAILIAQLVEQKKISYKEKLHKYFPKVPNSKKITLHHMLNHTSGLKGFIIRNGNDPTWLLEPVQASEIIDEIIRQGTAFEPGEDLRYSNGAYFLLTKIVEKKYKKTFKEIVENKILKPLKMNETNSVASSDRYNNIAKPYEKLEGWSEVKDFYFPNVAGVGDMVSTPQELNHFLHELFEYKIIKEKTLEEMLPRSGKPFGYGIMGIPFNHEILYGHGGDTRGTHCVMGYDRDQKLAITYMINGEEFLTNDFALDLLSIIYDQAYSYPKFDTYEVDTEILDTYVGTYGADNFPLKIKIFRGQNKLKGQGTGQPSFILKPVDKDEFTFDQAGLKIKFIPTENKLKLYQGGQLFDLKKEVL